MMIFRMGDLFLFFSFLFFLVLFIRLSIFVTIWLQCYTLRFFLLPCLTVFAVFAGPEGRKRSGFFFSGVLFFLFLFNFHFFIRLLSYFSLTPSFPFYYNRFAPAFPPSSNILLVF